MKTTAHHEPWSRTERRPTPPDTKEFLVLNTTAHELQGCLNHSYESGYEPLEIIQVVSDRGATGAFVVVFRRIAVGRRP